MTASAPATALTRSDQLNIFTVSIGHGITHWLHIVPMVLIVIIKEEFGLSYTEVGLYGSIYAAASTVMNVTGAPLTDVFGHRERFMIISLMIMVFSMIALGLSTNFVTFIAAAVVVALGNHLWHPAAIPYLATRYNDRRGYVLSIHSMFSSLGDSVAPAIVGGMISGWFFITFSWREAAFLNAIPALIALPLLFIVLFRNGSKENDAKKEGLNVREYVAGLWALLKDKAVLGIALMAGFRSTSQSSLRLFFPLYIATIITLSPEESAGLSAKGIDELKAIKAAGFAGLALTALNVGGAFAAIPAGIASDRFGRRPVVMWALALSTIFIFSLSLLKDEFSLIIGICLLGFSIYALRPVMVGWMMDIVPSEMRGSGTNLMFTTQSTMQMASPLIAGAIADIYGVVYVFYFCAALLLLANAVAFMLPKK